MTQKFLRDDGSFVPLAATGSSASGPITLITASLSSDVGITATSSYFDGPSVAQGSSGTWYASGTVTLATSGAVVQTFSVKLWDGTTVLDSCTIANVASAATMASVSGVLASPAGNLRISVKITAATNSLILFNNSANSKDSTLTAIRIG